MPRPSAYQPLIDHLAAHTEPVATLPLAAIEAIIDASLPASAYRHPAYWLNEQQRGVRDWQALGWRATLDVPTASVRFTRGPRRARRNSFRPLVEHLAARREGEVVLSFAAIEAIVGGALPPSAYSVPSYWSGTVYTHTRALQALGWSGRIDYRKRCVRFTREQEQPPSSQHAAAVDRTLEVIGGKWTVLILRELLDGERWFGQLLAAMAGASPKMISLRLKELERRGLVTRTMYPEIPPHVEYALTEEGRTLRPIIAAMAAWGERDGR